MGHMSKMQNHPASPKTTSKSSATTMASSSASARASSRSEMKPATPKTLSTQSASPELAQVQRQFFEGNRAIVAFTKSLEGQEGFNYENPELGKIIDDPEKGPVFALKGFTDPETGMEYPDPLVVYVDKDNQLQFQMDENTPLDKNKIWSDGRWKSMPAVLDRVAQLMGEAKNENNLRMSEFDGNVRGRAMVNIPKNLMDVTPKAPSNVASKESSEKDDTSLDSEYDAEMEAYQEAMAAYRQRQAQRAEQQERANSPYAQMPTAQLMDMARKGNLSEDVIAELSARMREDQEGTLAEIDSAKPKQTQMPQQDMASNMMMQMMASQDPSMAQMLPMLQMMNGGKPSMGNMNPLMAGMGNSDPQMAQMMTMMQMFGNGGKLV
jgi:hypothetical protein